VNQIYALCFIVTNWEECVDCMSAHLQIGCTNHKLYSEYSIVIMPEGYD